METNDKKELYIAVGTMTFDEKLKASPAKVVHLKWETFKEGNVAGIRFTNMDEFIRYVFPDN